MTECERVNTAQTTVYATVYADISPAICRNVSSFLLVYIAGSIDTTPHCCIIKLLYILFTCLHSPSLCCIVLPTHTYNKDVNSSVNSISFCKQGDCLQ